ncbi:MAG: D-aminoacyl-tRNA deacylase [Eubacteriales bacterium]|jgi:D-tyrosyl-tRNA(Tyr) deacylase|nr:D-tyrosyl-tRNA(Tyr) deacylase [Clostridiales bacterium]
MVAVFQRVTEASVTVDGKVVGECAAGCAILLGVAVGDTEADADKLAAKISKLRVFSDENGKLNKSVIDIGGSALVVPNFTIIADYTRGNRPDWFGAAPPDEANALFERFCSSLAEAGVPAAKGIFGADMLVSIKNDGPVTLVLDSRRLK